MSMNNSLIIVVAAVSHYDTQVHQSVRISFLDRDLKQPLNFVSIEKIHTE